MNDKTMKDLKQSSEKIKKYLQQTEKRFEKDRVEFNKQLNDFLTATSKKFNLKNSTLTAAEDDNLKRNLNSSQHDFSHLQLNNHF